MTNLFRKVFLLKLSIIFAVLLTAAIQSVQAMENDQADQEEQIQTINAKEPEKHVKKKGFLPKWLSGLIGKSDKDSKKDKLEAVNELTLTKGEVENPEGDEPESVTGDNAPIKQNDPQANKPDDNEPDDNEPDDDKPADTFMKEDQGKLGLASNLYHSFNESMFLAPRPKIATPAPAPAPAEPIQPNLAEAAQAAEESARKFNMPAYIEVITAILRGPLTAGALYLKDKHGELNKKAIIVDMVSKFTRIVNDATAFCNSREKYDINLGKNGYLQYFMPLIWIIQDTLMLGKDVKKLAFNKTQPEDSTISCTELTANLTKKQKLLVLGVLPAIEFIAATMRAYDSIYVTVDAQERSNWQAARKYISTCLITAERLISELIQNKRKSIEWYLTITKLVFTAAIILVDIRLHYNHTHKLEEKTKEEAEIPNEEEDDDDDETDEATTAGGQTVGGAPIIPGSDTTLLQAVTAQEDPLAQ